MGILVRAGNQHSLLTLARLQPLTIEYSVPVCPVPLESGLGNSVHGEGDSTAQSCDLASLPDSGAPLLTLRVGNLELVWAPKQHFPGRKQGVWWEPRVSFRSHLPSSCKPVGTLLASSREPTCRAWPRTLPVTRRRSPCLLAPAGSVQGEAWEGEERMHGLSGRGPDLVQKWG